MTKAWAENKDIIIRLYIHENRKLDDVQKIMNQTYGFTASRRAYHQHFDEWKAHKYTRRRRRDGSHSGNAQYDPSTMTYTRRSSDSHSDISGASASPMAHAEHSIRQSYDDDSPQYSLAMPGSGHMTVRGISMRPSLSGSSSGRTSNTLAPITVPGVDDRMGGSSWSAGPAYSQARQTMSTNGSRHYETSQISPMSLVSPSYFDQEPRYSTFQDVNWSLSRPGPSHQYENLDPSYQQGQHYSLGSGHPVLSQPGSRPTSYGQYHQSSETTRPRHVSDPEQHHRRRDHGRYGAPRSGSHGSLGLN